MPAQLCNAAAPLFDNGDLIIENATALPEPEPEKVEPAEAEKAAEAEEAENKAE